MALQIPVNNIELTEAVAFEAVLAGQLSITQRYSDTNAFLCLLTEIGLGEKERFRMLHDGYDSMEVLVDNYANDVEGFKKHLVRCNKNWMNHASPIMRVFFSPIIIDSLVGILYYFHTAVKVLHTIPCVMDISIDEAKHYGHTYKASLTSNDEDNEDVELPQLKEGKDWSRFKESFLMKLNLFKGVRGIPVDYVIDTTVRQYTRANMTRGEEHVVDIDEESLKTRTVHFGEGFKVDNRTVWNKLKVALIDKPGYNHISQFNATRNGRSAWMALITYYEGQHYQQHLREIAFSKLQNTFYRGETARFNFEKYINIHKESHKMLQDAQYNNGLGLDNETKVQYFRNGIKQDTGIEIALSNARSQAVYQDFGALISFLSAEVDHHKTRKAALNNTKNRHASAAGRIPDDDGESHNEGTTISGVKYDNDIPYKVVDGKRIEGRFYSKDEYRKMTPNQKTACNKMRSHAKGKKGKNGGKRNKNNNTSGVTRAEVREDMIRLCEATVAGVTQASADNGGATVASGTSVTEASSLTGGTRASGTSGSIGNFFRNRNQRRRRN